MRTRQSSDRSRSRNSGEFRYVALKEFRVRELITEP